MSYMLTVNRGLLPHKIRVMRLYRHSLRTSLDWAVDRDIFNEHAVLIREDFEKGIKETDPVRITKLIEEGEAQLKELVHPLPYHYPTNPGGTKWERNLPPRIDSTREEAFVEWE
eukprot:TRINITY_DN28142_c0_g1_i1.p1 TRINITY_DN28142_c0_g1~~TRINITY_DN28142_c0_g1_i1.p1  ORF type:complete len:114 (-),score=15.41 TRINITY_DN28142_c0_g1_i1:106-447(-)